MATAIRQGLLFEDDRKRWVRINPSKGFVSSSQGIEGPSGARFLGYEWRSIIGEGKDGPRAVSDWENAEICATCGRPIVHVYWVRIGKNPSTPYGADHVHLALGYKRELTPHQLTRLVDQQRREQAEDIARADFAKALPIAEQLVTNRARSTIVAADRAFDDEHPFRPGQPRREPCWLFSDRLRITLRCDDVPEAIRIPLCRRWGLCAMVTRLQLKAARIEHPWAF